MQVDADDSFDEALATIDEKRQAALRAGAEVLQQKARELVPKDTRALEQSLLVAQDGNEAAVYSNSPYAVKQHEKLSLKHTSGQAKYLETALLANQSAIERAIADALRLD